MRPFYFFWIVFGISFYWMGYLYQPFLMNLLIAALLCMATFWFKNFCSRFITSNTLSSLLSVLMLLTFLIIPIYLIGHRSVKFILGLDVNSFSNFIENTKILLSKIVSHFPALKENTDKIFAGISAQSIMDYAFKISSYITKYSLNLATDTCLILIFLFFFFYYGHRIAEYVLTLLPLKISLSKTIFNEIIGVLQVVFLTSIISIILQGFAFGSVAFWFGYDGFALGVLYGIFSSIPLGGVLIWGPIVGYEFYLGHTKSAIFIALYSLLFTGFVIDSLIKPLIIGLLKQKVLKTTLQINEILIFFSIVAGLSTFGFWGIIIGPAITAFFTALLGLYQKASKENLFDEQA